MTASGTGVIFSNAANVARVPSSDALSTATIAKSRNVWAKREGRSLSTSCDSLCVTIETRTVGVPVPVTRRVPSGVVGPRDRQKREPRERAEERREPRDGPDARGGMAREVLEEVPDVR